MIRYIILFLIFLLHTNLVPGQDNSTGGLIQDFSSNSFDGCTAEGRVFLGGPAGGERNHHINSFHGSGCACSKSNEGSSSGKLTSLPFIISNSTVHFYICARENQIPPVINEEEQAGIKIICN